MTRLAVVAWPDGLMPDGAIWDAIADDVARDQPDVLVTNEMPFGPWEPSAPLFDQARASAWAALHERGLEALSRLKARAVLSSRPVLVDGRLVNEAFVLQGGQYRALHHKHYFPMEDGWYEAAWFHAVQPGFDVHDVCGIKVGVLLCTELMFNEHARAMGRKGADVIATPRATGADVDAWEIAAKMAALTSGCYAVSSNRVGTATNGGPEFGGYGFVVAPGGSPLHRMQTAQGMLIVTLDQDATRAAKSAYPCYVKELSA
jgi:N-carbamoylputrescine amidase